MCTAVSECSVTASFLIDAFKSHFLAETNMLLKMGQKSHNIPTSSAVIVPEPEGEIHLIKGDLNVENT